MEKRRYFQGIEKIEAALSDDESACLEYDWLRSQEEEFYCDPELFEELVCADSVSSAESVVCEEGPARRTFRIACLENFQALGGHLDASADAAARVIQRLRRRAQKSLHAAGSRLREVRMRAQALAGLGVRWFQALPWYEMLAVRKGFLVGAIGGFAIAGSTLWGISSLPYFPGRALPVSVLTTPSIPLPHLSVPPELAWFFIEFPFVGNTALIRSKNHHTFVVSDETHRKEYVVTFGQRYRRVEVYNAQDKNTSHVEILTPGMKKTVWFRGPRVVGESNLADANMWMWKDPLWNATDLKIYGLADLWLDAPYKRYSCAGFVHKFLADAGVRVPLLDAWDIAKEPWMRVSRDEMEPGDIITIRALTASHRRFWHHRITHVGVYIGRGKMIHAATSAKGSRSWVRIADVDEFRGRIDKILRPPDLQ